MTDEHASLMGLLERLRSAGVKSATMDNGQVTAVEFFPSIPALDVDTLVPPAPADGEEGSPSVPPAFQRILKNGSVS